MKKVVLFLGVCLLASGCDDSKRPLSDPNASKADEHLVGVWKEHAEDGDTYYHVGHAGEKFPDSVMRVVAVKHNQGQVEVAEESLVFPTVLGGKSYLNVISDSDKKQVKRLDEEGWKAEAVDCYTLVKYQVDGDKLLAWPIDDEAKGQAIKDGKIKGVTGADNAATMTDTAENVTRFVAKAGDSLFAKEPTQFVRVDAAKKP